MSSVTPLHGVVCLVTSLSAVSAGLAKHTVAEQVWHADTSTTAGLNKLPQQQHQPSSETLPGMSAKSIQPSVAAAKNHNSAFQPTVAPFTQAQSASTSAASTSGRSHSSSSSNQHLHHQAIQLDGAIPQVSHGHKPQLPSTSSQDCNLADRASLHPASLLGMTSSSAAPHVRSSGAHSIQGLTVQIKQMKNEMIQYASLLDNPAWKQQQADGGKAVSEHLSAKQRDPYAV